MLFGCVLVAGMMKMCILRLSLCLTLMSSASLCSPYHSYVCRKTGVPSVEVPLHCSSAAEKIHVLHELIASAVPGSCNTTSKQCQRTFNTTYTSLVVDCNGRQSCNETVDKVENCASNNQLVRVTFECIKSKGQITMCEQTTRTITDGAVYLQSPGFPNSTAVSGSCSCDITGSQLSLQLLETTGLRNTSLVIKTDSKQMWPDILVRPILPQFNQKFVDGSMRGENISVKYDNNNNRGEDVWIKISGEGGVTVRCDGGNGASATALTAVITTSTTTSTSTSTSTSTTTTTSTSSTTSTSTSTTIPTPTPTSTVTTQTSKSTSTTPASSTKTSLVAHTSTFSQGYNTAEGELLTRQEWILAGGCAGGGVVFITVVVVVVICIRKSKRYSNGNEIDERTPKVVEQNGGPTFDDDPFSHENLSRRDRKPTGNTYEEIDDESLKIKIQPCGQFGSRDNVTTGKGQSYDHIWTVESNTGGYNNISLKNSESSNGPTGNYNHISMQNDIPKLSGVDSAVADDDDNAYNRTGNSEKRGNVQNYDHISQKSKVQTAKKSSKARNDTDMYDNFKRTTHKSEMCDEKIKNDDTYNHIPSSKKSKKLFKGKSRHGVSPDETPTPSIHDSTERSENIQPQTPCEKQQHYHVLIPMNTDREHREERGEYGDTSTRSQYDCPQYDEDIYSKATRPSLERKTQVGEDDHYDCYFEDFELRYQKRTVWA